MRENYQEGAGRFVEAITRPIKDAGLRDKIKALILKTPQYVAISEFEATVDPELWKADKIEVPTLMVLAKQPAWGPEYEKFVRELVPNLDYEMWENVSHFLMMEKPREFNAAVLKFLEQNQLVNRS